MWRHMLMNVVTPASRWVTLLIKVVTMLMSVVAVSYRQR